MILSNTSYTSCSKFLRLSSKIQLRADALDDQLKTKQLIAQGADVFQSTASLDKTV